MDDKINPSAMDEKPVLTHSQGDSSSGKDEFSEKMQAEEQIHAINVEKLNELADQLGDNQAGLAPSDDIQMVMDKIDALTVDEARGIIEELLIEHEWDYNFSVAQRDKLKLLLQGPQPGMTESDWEFELKAEAAVNKYYSPYPEVRAVTTPNDDPTIPCETIRAHLLGYIWAILGQFINSFFNSRFPLINLQSSVAQILLYPMGKLCAFVLPDWGITLWGTRHSLNPGPWTYKEQMLSTIIFDVSLTSAYVFWNIQTQTVFYHDTWLTTGYDILLLLSTQMMGLGFAGLLRRFVVFPVQTFWPSILPTLALNRALLVPEKRETIHGWSLSRYKFFFIFFIGMWVYFWFPDFIFNALSYFAWMTWIAPDNFNLAVVTGSQLGLGFNPISSFDWNVFTSNISPLTYPFWSTIQIYIAQVFGGLVILGMYYTNTKWTAYLPPNYNGIFDNTGSSYNVSRVIIDGVLDEGLYQSYSPAFYSAGNLLVYASFFAFYPLTFVFVILDSWRPITRAYRKIYVSAYEQVLSFFKGFGEASGHLFRGNIKQAGITVWNIGSTGSIYDGFDDPFTNLMRNYAEVPDWWFLSISLIAFIFAIILTTVYPDQTPVWTIFFVIGINIVFLIPMTYLYAVSGTTAGLNVLTELIIGYALPGNPNALMFAKAYGYNINGQADNYISDQKMGFYSKVPPRAMFRGQMISSAVACFIAYYVVNFIDTNIQGICTQSQPDRFNCEAGSLTYFSASVIWGLIGPARIFGQIYPIMKYAFLLGFLLGLAWWAVKRFGPDVQNFLRPRLPVTVYNSLDMAIFKPLSWLRNVHPSILAIGLLGWAPSNLTYSTSGVYMAIAFNYYLKRYKTAWWEKYNYVLAAALYGGVAFSGIIVFFAVQYKGTTLDWWGNNVVASGVDAYAGQTALLALPPNGTFGPATWT